MVVVVLVTPVTRMPLFGNPRLLSLPQRDTFAVYQTGKRASSVSMSQQNRVNSFQECRCRGVGLSHPGRHSQPGATRSFGWEAVLRCQREGGYISCSTHQSSIIVMCQTADSLGFNWQSQKPVSCFWVRQEPDLKGSKMFLVSRELASSHCLFSQRWLR